MGLQTTTSPGAIQHSGDMIGQMAVAFDRPPRGFSGLPERLAERRISVRSSDRCPLCGGADPLGLGSCLACTSRSGDRLIYIRRPPSEHDRLENLRLVHSLLPPHAPEFEAALVAGGHLALAAVSDMAIGNVEAALAERGLAVRSSSVRWSVASTPFLLAVVLIGVLLAGVLASIWISPWVGLLAPAVAAGLWFLAQFHLHRPVTRDSDRLPWLDSEDERTIVGTLTSLPRSRAKSLLVDLVRLGRLLHSRAQIAGDASVAEDTSALIVVAAEVATDLVHVRELADALLRKDAMEGGDPSEPEARVRLISSAVQLERLLFSAIAQLGGDTRRLLHQGLAGTRLSFLIHEIDRGRSAYRGAFREIEELLETREVS